MPDGMGGMVPAGGLAVALTAKDQASRVFTQVGKSSTAMAGTIGMAMARVNWAMVGAGAAFTIFTAIGIKKAMEFEIRTTEAMMMFGKITEETFTEAQNMARAMAREYGLAAEDTVKALYYLGSAGLTTAQAFEAMDAVIRFSRVGLIDTASAAETAMTAMKVFGYTAEDVGHVVDMMMEAVRGAQMTTQQLADAFAYVAPVAKSAGMTLAETSALIGKLADSGIRGSMAGTSLRRSIINLIAPTGRTQDALDRLGVSVYNAAGEQRDMLEVLSDVFVAMNNASEEVAAMAAQHIFGARAIAGMLALVDIGVEDIRDYAVVIEASTATQEMWADMAGTTSVQVGRLKESFSDLARKLGQAVLPIFKVLVSGLTLIMDALASIPEPLDKVVYGMIALAGPIMLIGGLLPLLKAGFVAIAGSMGSMGVGMLGLGVLIKSHIGLIMGLTAALAFLVTAFTGATGEVRVMNAEVNLLSESLLKQTSAQEALSLGAKEWGNILDELGRGFREMITLGQAETERERLEIDAQEALNILLLRHSGLLSDLTGYSYEYIHTQIETGKANELVTKTVLKMIDAGKSSGEILNFLTSLTEGYIDITKAYVMIEEIAISRAKERARELAREGYELRELVSLVEEYSLTQEGWMDVMEEYEDTIISMLTSERKQALSTYEAWKGALVDLVRPTEEQIVLLREYSIETGENFLAIWEESDALVQLADNFRLVRDEMESNISQLREYGDMIWDIQDTLRGYSIEEQQTRLWIEKIRRDAQKEGRELTDAEIAQIEELEIHLDDLRFWRMEERLEVSILRDAEEDLRYENEFLQRQIEDFTLSLQSQEWQLIATSDALEIIRLAGEKLTDWQRESILDTLGLTSSWKDFATITDEWIIPAFDKLREEGLDPTTWSVKELARALERVQEDLLAIKTISPTIEFPTIPKVPPPKVPAYIPEELDLWKRLTSGGGIFGRQFGGPIYETGPYLLHKGEYVQSAKGEAFSRTTNVYLEFRVSERLDRAELRNVMRDAYEIAEEEANR